MNNFQVGEKLVWSHVDEETGKKINEFVVIKAIPQRKMPTSKPLYTVQVLRTGEPATVWGDELFRYSA